MAIEFNCPYCAAMIRVPDNAGGGKGRCPRCSRRITVPKVSTKAAPKPPNPEDLLDLPGPEGDAEVTFATAAPADFAEATDDQFAPAPGDQFASMPADPFVPAPRPLGQLPVEPTRQPLRPGSIASKLKRKKSGGSWTIPVGFGLVLIAAVGWFVWQQYQSERLVGELTAEFATMLELPAAEVDKGLLKQSPEELSEVLATLEKSSVPFSSKLMHVQIGANKRSLTVRLSAGLQTQFYKVETQDIAPLISYRKKHTLELEDFRLAELERAGTDFINDYKKKVPLSDYRNTLGIPALVRGLGLQLQAVYGNTPYPCVYEDREGALYFLLPRDAKGFEIQGRKHNGKTLFPGKYQVNVTGEMKAPTSGKTDPAPGKNKRKIEPLDEEKMKEPSDTEEMKKGMDKDR